MRLYVTNSSGKFVDTFSELGGGGVRGVNLRGVSLSVSWMLLPSMSFLPQNLGGLSPPPSPSPWNYHRGITRCTHHQNFLQPGQKQALVKETKEC